MKFYYSSCHERLPVYLKKIRWQHKPYRSVGLFTNQMETSPVILDSIGVRTRAERSKGKM
jgi:hypothetical protein